VPVGSVIVPAIPFIGAGALGLATGGALDADGTMSMLRGIDNPTGEVEFITVGGVADCIGLTDARAAGLGLFCGVETDGDSGFSIGICRSTTGVVDFASCFGGGALWGR
jgi:hypothetical protein